MWDVDDVLNDLMWEWFTSSWRITHPECCLEYSMITRNPPHELLGVPKNEYLDSLDAFRNNSFRALKPIPEMLEWFRLNGRKAEHIVVTSVPVSAAHHSAEWVFAHFGEWIRSFNVVPSTRLGDIPDHGPKTKAEFIRTFSKVDIVVEDNPETICSMQQLGISTITIPRPWNEYKATLPEAMEGLTTLL